MGAEEQHGTVRHPSQAVLFIYRADIHPKASLLEYVFNTALLFDDIFCR